MALASTTIGDAAATPATFAAPTTAEEISDPGRGVFLYVKVGATATTVTVVRPGTHAAGDAVNDLVLTGLQNEDRIIRIGREYRNPADGNADVTFSQVTGVTALLLRT